MARRPPKPASPRTLRRADERSLERLAEDRIRLAKLSPGGAAERPISVESASLVELRASALPCPRCEGEPRVDEHTAHSVGGDVLRAARTSCKQCGFERVVWFRIAQRLAN
jgi:hypothetical protein